MDEELLLVELAALPEEAIIKATLNAAARKKLSDADFAYIDSKGRRHLPIHDEGHVKAAMGRFNQTHFESDAQKAAAKRKINAAAKKFGIEVADDDNVSKADGEPAGIFIQIEKADELLGVIYGVASVANAVDLQGDVIKPETLRKAAHGFIANYNAADDTHRSDMPGKFVESWLDGDNWRVAFRPDDIEIAKAAARGEYVGFSIEGTAKRVEVQV